jgi:hypothetical protein
VTEIPSAMPWVILSWKGEVDPAEMERRHNATLRVGLRGMFGTFNVFNTHGLAGIRQ